MSIFKKYYSILLIILLLAGCSDEDNIDIDFLTSAPETLTINNESYLLNGFIYDDDKIVAAAELAKENKTDIDPFIEIVKIYLIKNDRVYQSSSLRKMDPTDAFTLISQVENVPEWTLDTETQMIVEIKADNEIFFIKDTDLEL